MLTKTIGQLSAAASITTADYVEIEQGGASKYGTVTQLVAGIVATSAQTLLGSVNTAVLTPATLRAGINAENAPPIYACRAWVHFDGTTTSSSLTGTYTRVVGTTQTVCVATAHGMITGNVQYIDFTSGGASDNSYIVTVTDADTFTVNTVSTSSILTSNLSLHRSPVQAGGNIGVVSYNTATAGTYFVNFQVAMPTQYYAAIPTAETTNNAVIASVVNDVPPTVYALKIVFTSDGGSQVARAGAVAVFA
jgi:hypothetical protein